MSGGGGGGFFASIDNALSQTRDALETSFSGGANQTDEGKKWKKAGDTFVDNTSGKTARDAAEKGAFEAKRAQAQREADIAEQDMKAGNQSKFGAARNRQKSLAGNGRSSTILTSPLGVPSSSSGSSGKTLLGS